MFRKVSYKFIMDKNATNRIELKLFDSQLTDRINEEDLAKECARTFIRKFSAGPEYAIVDVWFINSRSPIRIKDAVFTFSRTDL